MKNLNANEFYNHYNLLIDEISTILDIQPSYDYIKNYLYNLVYTLQGKEYLLYNMEIKPYSFVNTNDRYLQVSISGLILYHRDEDLKDPIDLIIDKYPLLKDFFEFNGRKDFNTFVYTFKISSYQKLQQLDTLIKLMQRRDI